MGMILVGECREGSLDNRPVDWDIRADPVGQAEGIR